MYQRMVDWICILDIVGFSQDDSVTAHRVPLLRIDYYDALTQNIHVKVVVSMLYQLTYVFPAKGIKYRDLAGSMNYCYSTHHLRWCGGWVFHSSRW